MKNKFYMTFEDFLNITNIESVYLYTDIEERENCLKKSLIDSPKIGFKQRDYNNLKTLKIKEISINGNIISIILEKQNDNN